MAAKKRSTSARRASGLSTHTAWKKAQSAWKRTEKSIADMVKADQALFHSLGDAGNAAVKKVKAELKVRGKQFDKARGNAMKEFHRLTKRLEGLRNKPAAKARSSRSA